MTNKMLFALWGGLFIICAGLGFIPEADGVGQILLTIVSVVFFVPPGVLLHRAKAGGNQRLRHLVRNLAALSLLTTSVLLVLNLMSATWPEFTGTVLHYTLAVVSAPMFCAGAWALSLFLWACLLIAGCRK